MADGSVQQTSQLVYGLREQIVTQIRKDVFAGRLSVGERLSENSLVSKFKVSRTPIREALHQLVQEGVYDTTRNHYFATHCTCATKLQGSNGPSQDFMIRPFFHHLPKTAALDVQWTPGSPALLMKYAHEHETIHGWTGKVIESPKCPPTGGCATRVLVDIDDVHDITTVYAGPHPTLYSIKPSEARCLKIFAKLHKAKLAGNI